MNLYPVYGIPLGRYPLEAPLELAPELCLEYEHAARQFVG